MKQRRKNNNHISGMAVWSLWHETHIREQETELEAQNTQNVAWIQRLDQYTYIIKHIKGIVLTKGRPRIVTVFPIRNTPLETFILQSCSLY